MSIVIKKLDIKKTTATVTLEWFDRYTPTKELEALAVLLGGYNEFGRKIDLDTHRRNIIKFKELLDEVEEAIS